MPNKTAKNGCGRETNLKYWQGERDNADRKKEKGTFNKRIGIPVDRQQ